MPFVQGYGGRVVAQGEFPLDAAALTGLAAYVDLLRRFAPPHPTPVSAADAPAAEPSQFGRNLGLWCSPTPAAPACQPSALQVCFGTQRAGARFPRLPVSPVIGTIGGFGLANVPRRRATTQAIDAATGAMACLLSSTGRKLLAANESVPVVAESAAHGLPARSRPASNSS